MIFNNIFYTIPREKVLLRLQFNKKKTKLVGHVKQLIDSMIDEGNVLAQPQAIVEDFTIKELARSRVVLSGKNFSLAGEHITRHVDGCYKVSLMVCTVGSQFAGAVEGLVDQRELTKAAILDAVASEAVDAVADAITKIIRQNAENEGADITLRFSPGYGDWDIQEQKPLLEVMEAYKIGVRLTNSFLMFPEKSITACVGWRK
ncbi:MAG: hypothetical protein KKH94_10940 [Candidatus Omnitrophica bacterium]|nr:hypothetical protein [Candidatus Omnitrophota bacterium]